MDIETLKDLVANLGLPIVLIGFMCYFIFLLWKQSAKRETKLYEELAASREINQKAINTIAQYAEMLGDIKEDVKGIKDNMAIITARFDRS